MTKIKQMQLKRGHDQKEGKMKIVKNYQMLFVFLTLMFAGLTQANAGNHPPLFLECSNRGEGDYYAEVQIDKFNAITGIIAARYLERQGPTNPKYYSAWLLVSRTGENLGYSTTNFSFAIRPAVTGSPGSSRLFVSGQSVKFEAPCVLSASSVFPQVGPQNSFSSSQKQTLLDSGRMVQCCHYNCNTGQSVCSMVSEGSCAQHACH